VISSLGADGCLFSSMQGHRELAHCIQLSFVGAGSDGMIRPQDYPPPFENSTAEALVMVALCNRADHYIFALWFLLSSVLFFLA